MPREQGAMGTSGVNAGRVRLNTGKLNPDAGKGETTNIEFPINTSAIGKAQRDMEDILEPVKEKETELKEAKIEALCEKAEITREQFDAAMQIKEVEGIIERQLEDAIPEEHVPIELLKMLQTACPIEDQPGRRPEPEDAIQSGPQIVRDGLFGGNKLGMSQPTTLKPPMGEEG